MKIAIDFDGTICDRLGIPTIQWGGYERPKDGSLEAVKYLLSLGHEIWIFTSNPHLDLVEKWLEAYNFPKLEVTNIKKPAQVYIDDRGLRFTNWQDIRKYFG